MAINYTQTDTSSGLCSAAAYCTGQSVGGDTSVRLAQDGGTAGSTEDTVDVTKYVPLHYGAGDNHIYFEIQPAAGTTWAAGDWTVRLNVTSADKDVDWAHVYICRVNSSCVNQATIGSWVATVGDQAQMLDTVQTYTETVSGSAQTPDSGDKVLVIIGLAQTRGAGKTESIGYTPSVDIDSPFTAAAAPLFPSRTDRGRGPEVRRGYYAT